MSISDTFKEIKVSVQDRLNLSLSHDIFVILLILFVALASFGLGKLSVLSGKKTPIRIESSDQTATVLDKAKVGDLSTITRAESSGNLTVDSRLKSYVASKTGKKYYFPWCGTALRIAEENKVWFATIEDARAKGYTPATNCKGLK